MIRTRYLLAFFVFGSVLSPGLAQTKYPPRAETLDVTIRYRIRADRDERVRQFRQLEANLKSLEFAAFPKEDADLDILDPSAERFSGTIPSKNVLKLLDDPRVQTILFAPAGYTYPDSVEKPVSVRIGIPSGLPPRDQQRLHSQIVDRLALLGFREAISYDTRGNGLIRGSIPYGNLGRLVKDLRREPAGWFLPDQQPEFLPSPLREVLPIRWVEVVPNADFTYHQPPIVAPERAAITPDLRAILDDPAEKLKPLRVEVMLDRPVDDVQLSRVRTRLRAGFITPAVNPRTKFADPISATVEGGIGHVITINFPVGADAERLLEVPGVIGLRLPRAGFETVTPFATDFAPGKAADLLNASRFDQLHKLGYRGQGTRIVIIGSEFPGITDLIGKDLPANTLFIDLTTELTLTLDPQPPVANRVSGGLAAARAAHLVAPDAQLVLIRIDPTAFFQVLSVSRYIRGDTSYSEALQSRISELSLKAETLRRQYLEAVAEYQRAFQSFSDDPAPRARRERAKADLEVLIEERKLLTTWINRTNTLHESLTALHGSQVLINTLVWETGYRLDGLSEMSQIIDQTFAGEADRVVVTRSATRPKFAVRPVWVQAASPRVGSVWGGPYIDLDETGIMEFAPPASPLPPEAWTRELNFLGVRSLDGNTTGTLPMGRKVRLNIQWREPHDPNSYGTREAFMPLRLRVFRQYDPTGQMRASDELQEVARSVGGPYRVSAQQTYGVYEQIVEFTVPEDGSYCVRVDGARDYDPILPALKPDMEITPRLFVEFLDTPPTQGRPVFTSFAPRDVGVGIPGDAKSALTFGATDAPNSIDYTGLTGGGTGVALLTKPDLLVDGMFDTGTGLGGPGLSAGYGGGAAAVLVGGGVPPGELLRWTGIRPGGALMLTEDWLKMVPPRK